MKVNQIVSEHKKGFRAKKYASKPKNTIAPNKPEPIKPQGPIGAGDEKKIKEDATVTKTDATTGTEVTDTATGVKTTLPPDKAAALMPDAEKPGEFDLNPNAVAPSGSAAGTTSQTPKVGSKVEIKTAESANTPYFVDTSSGTPMAKTSPRPTAIVASKMWTAITPDIEAKASAQGFRKVMLQHNGKQVTGLEGGDPKLGSKIIVAPLDYDILKAPQGGNTPRKSMGIHSAEKTGIGSPPMARESAATAADDALLEKMRMIAGLR